MYYDLEEDSADWNSVQRGIIAACKEKHNDAWLVNINDKDHPLTRVDGFVHNFQGSAVIPSYDETLQKLILDRLNAPYTGTVDDARRLEPIQNRISELGGKYLFWL